VGEGRGPGRGDRRPALSRPGTAARAICEHLALHVEAQLPEALGKLWHAHPVWFLEGNPVVGYSHLVGGVRLLFWSGQSFDEPALLPSGKFQAAEARFSRVEDVDLPALHRWLSKARDIQWDYQHIVARKGRLERLR
jgi:hypothetical protein